MILSYHTNYHFELIYSKKEDQSNIAVYNNFEEIMINEDINKDNIKLSGVKFSNKYGIFKIIIIIIYITKSSIIYIVLILINMRLKN